MVGFEVLKHKKNLELALRILCQCAVQMKSLNCIDRCCRNETFNSCFVTLCNFWNMFFENGCAMETSCAVETCFQMCYAFQNTNFPCHFQCENKNASCNDSIRRNATLKLSFPFFFVLFVLLIHLTHQFPSLWKSRVSCHLHPLHLVSFASSFSASIIFCKCPLSHSSLSWSPSPASSPDC